MWNKTFLIFYPMHAPMQSLCDEFEKMGVNVEKALANHDRPAYTVRLYNYDLVKEAASMAGTLVRDMTEGSPTRRIVEFFFPLLFGLLFQQVYNMVDTIVVGKFLGVTALAGVGSTGSLSFLVLGFCIGVCNGFAIPVAQKFGERDYPGLKRFVVNAIMLAVAFSLVMTAVVCSLCSPLLGWMNTPADIVDDAFAYIFVIFLGIPVVFIYNVLFSIIRSLGDSRTAGYLSGDLLAAQRGADLLFILAFGMGVEGAAWATVISQAVSSLLCVNYIRHCDLLILTRRDWKIDKTCIKRLVGMGVPTGLQYSITAIGSIVLQASVNLLGSSYVASVAAGSKVSQLFCCPFGRAGQHHGHLRRPERGRGKLERIGKGLKSCSAIGIVYSLAAFGGAVDVWRKSIANVHGCQGDPGNCQRRPVLNRELGRLHPAGLCQHRALFDSGPGFTRQAVFAGVLEMVARVIVGVVMVPAFGYIAVCAASPAAWVAADLFLFPAYGWAMRQLAAAREKSQKNPPAMPGEACADAACR